MNKNFLAYLQTSVQVEFTLKSAENEGPVTDIQESTRWVSSEDMVVSPSPRRKSAHLLVELHGKNIMNHLTRLKRLLPLHYGYHTFQCGGKKCEAFVSWAKPRAQTLVKNIKIISLIAFILMIPGADALSNFELKKAIPAVYSQLAQNAVVTSFGVLCSSDGGRSPIDALSDGPLSSISSALWLWRMRKDRVNDRHWFFATIDPEHITTTDGIMRQSAINAMPVIALTSGAFVMYFIAFLESHELRWALTVCLTGLASEATRLLATWLATISVEMVPHLGEENGTHRTNLFVTSGMHNTVFIECQDGKLQPTISWQKYTETSAVATQSLQGSAGYKWRWTSIKKAIMSLLLFCLSAMFAVFCTGALVASEDGSLAGGLLSFLICYCAAGKLSSGIPTDIPNAIVYQALFSAARLGMVVGQIGGFSLMEATHSHEYMTLSMLATSDEITVNGRKVQVYKPQRENEIHMHDFYRKYAAYNTNIARIFQRTDVLNGRSIMLDIADALYCRALLLIRHVHSCPRIVSNARGRVCDANTEHFLSALLLVSDHIECPGAFEILSEIKTWMDHEDLLWSIIGSKLTLEMMALRHLRRQLESSNPLDLALRICHMAMYESVPTNDMLEAVPTVMYYLLTGNTVLGHATARVVEHAIRLYGAANIIPDCNEVILRVGDSYTIHCDGELHKWPGGFIPILSDEAMTDQPANYNMARAMYDLMLKGQRLGHRNTQYVNQLSIT